MALMLEVPRQTALLGVALGCGAGDGAGITRLRGGLVPVKGL